MVRSTVVKYWFHYAAYCAASVVTSVLLLVLPWRILRVLLIGRRRGDRRLVRRRRLVRQRRARRR